MKYILYTCSYIWNPDGYIHPEAISENINELNMLGSILTLGEQESYHIYEYDENIYTFDTIINKNCKKIDIKKINYLQYLGLNNLPKALQHKYNGKNYVDDILLSIFQKWLCNYHFSNNTIPSKTEIYDFLKIINRNIKINYIDSLSKIIYKVDS